MSVTILAVDDNPTNLDLVTRQLDGAGYRVLVARTADLALERALRNAPDLILLDVKMPGTDGFELCGRIRNERELAKTPVIFMTALTDEESKQRAFKAGAVDYITKPLSGGELLARVATHVEMAAYRRSLEDEIERRTAELRRYSAEQSLLLDTMEAQVWYLTDEQTYGLVNRAHAEFLGRSSAEVENRTLDELLPAEVAGVCRESNRAAFAAAGPVRTEEWAQNATGEQRLLSITKTPKTSDDGFTDYIVCVAVDVTEEFRLRERLRTELREKELLVREVHHRVKNNLSVVASLLQLQLAGVESGADAVESLRSSSDRIHAMAHIHQQIYEAGLLSELPLGAYVRSLVAQLQGLYDPDGRVTITTDVDDILVDVTMGIPCGIIINELITNALKHAFPDDASGSLSIRVLKREQACHLEVIDDGVGSDLTVTDGPATSLGVTLIRALCDQLGATLSVDSASGTRVTIEAPLAAETPHTPSGL
ncbi:MAG: sensor histidine kinase [Spirochaetota bacterium]